MHSLSELCRIMSGQKRIKQIKQAQKRMKLAQAPPQRREWWLLTPEELHSKMMQADAKEATRKYVAAQLASESKYVKELSRDLERETRAWDTKIRALENLIRFYQSERKRVHRESLYADEERAWEEIHKLCGERAEIVTAFVKNHGSPRPLWDLRFTGLTDCCLSYAGPSS